MRPPAPLLVLCLLPLWSAAGQFASDPDSLPAPRRDTTVTVMLPGTLDTSRTLTRTEREWIDYLSIADLAAEGPGVYLRDQNSLGQYTAVTVRGAGWRSATLALDGRTLADPASGVFNPFHIAPEQIERVEFIPAPRAFLYGEAAAGGLVNYVTRVYDHDVPLTKVNYSESSYDLQWTDGTFSQNVARGANVTLGFQTHSIAGRYPSSASTLWNTRADVRLRVVPTVQARLSHRYTSTNTRLNGGIDTEATLPDEVFSPSQAAVVNPDSYEKLSRHDIELTLFGTPLGDDHPGVLSLYYSWNLREYRDEEFQGEGNGIAIQADHRSSWMGGRFRQEIRSSWQTLAAGGELELRQIEGSPTLGRRRNVNGAIWAKEELRPIDLVTVSVYGRYDRYLRQDRLGYGTDVQVRPPGPVSFFGGLSRSWRLPSYHELFWTDSSVTRPAPVEPERHLLGELGARFDGGPLAVSAAFVYRRVEAPIVFLPGPPAGVFPAYTIVNGEMLKTLGLDGRLRLRVWSLVLEGSALWLRQTEAGSTLGVYPEWSGSGGLYFWDSLFDGDLDLKAGFQARMQSSSTGEVFDPGSLAYVRNDGPAIGSYATVGLFLIARIGDAYLHIMWENLPDIQAYATPYYPLLDRTLRFGLRWEFLN